MSTQTMSRNFARNTGGQARTPNPRTPGQLNFLKDLVTQIATYDRERGVALWTQLRDLDNAGELTFNIASSTITELKAERNELRIAQQVDPREDRGATQQPRPEIPEGRYAVDTDEGHLAFYRVRVADNGFITVTVYASDNEHELPWKAQLGILRKIEADGVTEAMIRYGKEIKICGAPNCNRKLTKQDSRDRGIGPICAGKMGV